MTDRDRIRRLLDDLNAPVGEPPRQAMDMSAMDTASRPRSPSFWLLVASIVAVVCATLVALIVRFA